MKTITFFTNATAPYRTLQMRELAKIEGIRLRICYYEKKTRQWEIEPAGQRIEEEWLDMIPPFDGRIHWKLQLHRRLRELVKSSDMIMSGSYYTISDNLLVALCKRYKKPFVLLMDGFEPHRIWEKENKFKHRQKSWVLENTAMIWGNGTVCREYYTRQFSYPQERIINQCLTVDVDKIGQMWENREALQEEIRKKYGIELQAKVVMYSGRLVKIKNVDLLIRAMAVLPEKENYILFVVGDGKQRESYEALAKTLGVRMIVTGFITEQQTLFRMYYAADCLVLPSVYDPWGLVINEAMSAHLPVIGTNYCGASMDLIQNGKNGYVLEQLEAGELAKYIADCVQNKEAWGENSWNMIQNWTFRQSAENFRHLLQKIDLI